MIFSYFCKNLRPKILGPPLNSACILLVLNMNPDGENSFIHQSPKNPLVLSSLPGKTWSGQVDFPSLSNCRTSAKWQADE